MRKLYLLLCLIGVMSQLHAETIQLLTQHMGPSSKMIAVGNIEGMFSSSTAVFENPAALMNSGTSMSFLQTQLSDQDSSVLCVTGAFPYFYGQVGLGVLSLETKNIDKTAVNDSDQFYSLYKFGTKNAIYSLGYQTFLDQNLSWGVNLKYVDQDLFETSGKGFNMDTGFVYDDTQSRLSLNFKNILKNSKVHFSESNSYYEFPFEMSLGGRTRMDDFYLMSQLKYVDSDNLLLKAFGVEYRPDPKEMALFLGWKEVPVNGVSKQTASVGTEIEFHPVTLTLSYEISEFIEQNSRYYFSFEYREKEPAH